MPTIKTGARAITGLPAFYKCRRCGYWHAASVRRCMPERNGYTVAVLDALHPDQNGDGFGDWRAVRAPRGTAGTTGTGTKGRVCN
jgi:hypothetical protein